MNESATKLRRSLTSRLYPSLMVRQGYTSRNILDDTLFEQIYWDRLKAKNEGDKVISDTYKLILNTTYGCMLNPYNDLYDPLMGRSVCVSGQLFLTDLAVGYLEQCETIGVLFSISMKLWLTESGYEVKSDA